MWHPEAVAPFAIAGVLVAVYTLPESVTRPFVFQYGEPTLLTAYTANFVHFAPSHLATNLAGFLLAGGTLVAVSIRADDRWFLIGTGVTFLTVVPVLLSVLNLAVPRAGITYGFSGMNMVLVGFLPVAIVRYGETLRNRRVGTEVLLVSFFTSVAIIAAVSVPPSALSTAVMVAAAGLGAVFGVQLYFSELGSGPFDASLRTVCPVIAAAVVWAALPSTGFPDPARNGEVINIYVHFVGYALGFISGYLSHECLEFSRRFY